MSTARRKLNFSLIFFQQCNPVINDSFLLDFSLLTNERIDQIPIESIDIFSLIRQLNPNMATGSDGISPHMFCYVTNLSCFSNILSTAIYPDTWKLTNVTPIFKKGDKQLIKNYRPIPPSCLW